MSKTQAKNARRATISALRAWSKGHDYAETLVERHAQRNQLSREDRALFNNLLLTTLRNLSLLDFWIKKLRREKLDFETRDILRVGLAQLFILNIAEHAAIFETVNCSKPRTRGLINAILRNAQRQKADLLSSAKEQTPDILYSCPTWLYKHWCQQFGEKAALKLLKWQQNPALTYLRLNTIKLSKQERAELGADELVSAVGDGYPNFYQWKSKGIPKELLSNGDCYIQDPSTYNAVRLLNPKAGETILDACAAPGGKTSLIAALSDNQAKITITDLEKKIPRLESNLVRLGVSDFKSHVHDWLAPAPSEWHKKFDAILLDVPCSNTGVLRRRLDARWRLQASDVEKLIHIQAQIFQNALACIKPGGRIVYSTCSIDQQENQEQVQRILEKNPKLQLIEEHSTRPDIDGIDGSYAAVLQLN